MTYVIRKLKQDIERYLVDYNLSTPIKLLIIIDFWPVMLFRLTEYFSPRKTFTQKLMGKLLTIASPIINGFCGVRIIHGAEIGGGLLLHHCTGVVIAKETKIGNNCTIYSGACVVNKANGKRQGGAIIGNNTRLMVGCKIIGNINIGDNVTIGANAVVLHDIPPDCTAVGVPAKVILRHKNEHITTAY